MLTLLLCFFIVFYNSNAANPESKVDIQKLFLSQKVGAPGQSESGESSGSSSSSRRELASETIKGVVLRLNPAHATVSQQSDHAVELIFKEVSFFKPGSVALTEEGKNTVDELMKVLDPVKGQVRITVRGHTDSSGVSKSKNRYSDNWELSVLRATQVLKTFLNHQYDQSTLSAEGFADTQVEAIDRAYQRRVTFKIEVRS